MYGPMTGASAWMMTSVWDVPHLVVLGSMWIAMMAAMMLPSAAPALLLYAAAVRRSEPHARASSQTYALAAGYLTVWALFSIGATVLQRVLTRQLLLSNMMALSSSTAGAVVLFVAGAYQLTPLKRACLHTCQSPLTFLMRKWRTGLAGAFRMGFEHGAYCLGCCWALMLLLFVGGVMNLLVIGALAAFVVAEKLGWLGPEGARVTGGFLIAIGVWIAVR
jgi:predicted metal-binding membrane protein